MYVPDNYLTLDVVDGIPLGTPLIGWRNVVTIENVSATTEEDEHPASNLANTSTVQRWQAAASSPTQDEYITVLSPGADEIDYLAVARHNFGSAAITVSVEGYTELTGSPEEPDWFELVQETALEDDSPVLFRFEPQVLLGIRLKMQAGDDVPNAAVLYVGKLLVMERGIEVNADHVPLNLGRVNNVVVGRAESGDFLGRIVTGSHVESTAQFSHLRKPWFLENMEPFIEASAITPFFYVWNPDQYPEHVGYASLSTDPQPAVSPVTGRYSLQLQMRGVIR